MSSTKTVLFACAIVSGLISLNALLGSPWLAAPGMMPLTASCTLLAALATALGSSSLRAARTSSVVAAGAVTALAGLTLSAYAFDITLHMDNLNSPGEVGVNMAHPVPGRMSIGASLSLLLAGLAIAAAGIGGKARRCAPWIGTTSLLTPALSLFGYMTGTDVLHEPGFLAGMALPSSVALLFLGAGAIVLVPEAGWLPLTRGSGPGASTARTLLPLVLIGPYGVSWLLNLGLQVGLYGTSFRISVIASLVTILLGIAVVRHARRLDREHAAARASERRLSLFIESAPAAIAMFDRDMRYLAVSRRYLRDYDLDHIPGIIGKSHFEVLPSLSDRWREIHQRTLSGHVTEIEEDVLPRSDGRTDWVRWRMEPWHGDDGRIEGSLLFSEVITAQREASQALRESEAGLRRVIEEVPFPAILHADDGEVLLLSKTWLDLTGYQAGDIRTVSDWTARAFGERGQDMSKDLEKLYDIEHAIDEGDYEIRSSDGRKLVWAFRSAPVGRDNQGRRLVVSAAADITERRENEDRLRYLMREVDHRAKNALAVMQAIVQLSRSEDPQVYTETVQGRIAAMARAHSILAETEWSGVDLGLLIRGELSAFGKATKADMSGPHVVIRAEAVQAITLALHELASNATYHGSLTRPEGSLWVSWKILDGESEILCIVWQERGVQDVMMPKEEGLGITMIRQAVEHQLGGRFHLETGSNGILCRIELPPDIWRSLAVPRDVAIETAVASPHPNVEGRRILVVEDEALTGLALELLLEEAGYEVIGPAARVQDALDLFESQKPQAAILDVNLFGESAMPIADALDRIGVPFIFCTGYQRGENIAPQHASAPVLAKPINGEYLLAAVNRLLTVSAAPAE